MAQYLAGRDQRTQELVQNVLESSHTFFLAETTIAELIARMNDLTMNVKE